MHLCIPGQIQGPSTSLSVTEAVAGWLRHGRKPWDCVQDATFEMERKRNRPEKYNRELVHKTIKGVEKVSAVCTQIPHPYPACCTAVTFTAHCNGLLQAFRGL